MKDIQQTSMKRISFISMPVERGDMIVVQAGEFEESGPVALVEILVDGDMWKWSDDFVEDITENEYFNDIGEVKNITDIEMVSNHFIPWLCSKKLVRKVNCNEVWFSGLTLISKIREGMRRVQRIKSKGDR